MDPSTMTADRFCQCQEILGWRHRTMARRLRRNTNLPLAWARGTEPVPADVAEWLENVVRVIAKAPISTRHATRSKAKKFSAAGAENALYP